MKSLFIATVGLFGLVATSASAAPLFNGSIVNAGKAAVARATNSGWTVLPPATIAPAGSGSGTASTLPTKVSVSYVNARSKTGGCTFGAVSVPPGPASRWSFRVSATPNPTGNANGITCAAKVTKSNPLTGAFSASFEVNIL